MVEGILRGNNGNPSYKKAHDSLIEKVRKETPKIDSTLALAEVTSALVKWSKTASTLLYGQHLGHLKALMAPDG